MSTTLPAMTLPELKEREVSVVSKGVRRSLVLGLVAVLLAAIAVVRIVSTYNVFSQTSDEPAHIATGMEWLQWGTYNFEPLHPPLARIAVAAGPYLSGLRLLDHRNLWIEGNELLLARGDYLRNLSLARAGVLPFFLLATFLVWHWARSRYGIRAAVVATFLFTTSPLVLAHAGVATTDMAATATFTAALFTYIGFLERPTIGRATFFGVAAGLALLSKFSALIFLPACCVTILLSRWLAIRRTKTNTLPQKRIRPIAVAAAVIFLTVWMGYRCSLSSATTAAARPHYTIDQMFGTSGSLHNAAYTVAEYPFIPAPAFFQGLAKLRFKESVGHKSYLLGEVRETGWWYFFPVALAIKSTIPFLVLGAVGIFYLVNFNGPPEERWISLAPVVAAGTILLVCAPSHINIGVRHILPIVPVLAIIGGLGASQLWCDARTRYAGPVVVLVLLSWQVVSSVRSHPDYLAYFNEFAGSHPENILIGSDLDWGQDLLRLSAALQQRHIDRVSIAYAGSSHMDLTKFNLPPFKVLEPYKPVAGWVAISFLDLKVGDLGAPTNGFAWLEAYKPVALVGRSILLYHIPESADPQSVAKPTATQ
jgi:hypothetical protein